MSAPSSKLLFRPGTLILQRGVLLALFLFLAAGLAGAVKTDPPEIPKHLMALGSKAELLAAKTVWVTAESRSAASPANAETIAWLRERGIKSLAKTPYRMADSPATADLWMQLLEEPHFRYGFYHYQNVPYYFLILRVRREQKMIYCGFQRVGFDLFETAIGRLLREFRSTLKRIDSTAVGAMETCAKQARRPVGPSGK